MEVIGRGSDQVSLRLPPGMRGTIKTKARENLRSMNSEIVARLQTTLEEESPKK